MALTDFGWLTGPTAWTPVDASGAGLSFSSVAAYYYRIDKLIVANFRLTFPSTADATASKIGGLPLTNHAAGANIVSSSVLSTLGADIRAMVHANAATFTLMNESGVSRTNAALSTILVVGTIIYFAG
jgi:hypothetical protein